MRSQRVRENLTASSGLATFALLAWKIWPTPSTLVGTALLYAAVAGAFLLVEACVRVWRGRESRGRD